jgi:hypothetical protein
MVLCVAGFRWPCLDARKTRPLGFNVVALKRSTIFERAAFTHTLASPWSGRENQKSPCARSLWTNADGKITLASRLGVPHRSSSRIVSQHPEDRGFKVQRKKPEEVVRVEPRWRKIRSRKLSRPRIFLCGQSSAGYATVHPGTRRSARPEVRWTRPCRPVGWFRLYSRWRECSGDPRSHLQWRWELPPLPRR